MSQENARASAEVPPDIAAVRQDEAGHNASDRPAQDVPPPGKKASGLLGNWLRRSEPQGQSSSLLTVKTGSSTPVAEPGTPTWSDTSETSEFPSVEASPAAKGASAAAVFNHPQAMGQPHTRLAGRLGGWLTGVTSAAGVVLGGAVRGGTKALQRLTAQEQLQDLHAASQHLEATASGLQGEARVQTLQKWCTLLRELHPSHLPLLQPYTLSALHPNSPHRASCDNDWQQLQFASEPPDPNAGHTPASMRHSHHQKAGPGSSSSGSAPIGAGQQGHAAKGSELEFWANQVLYLEQESPDTKKELLTFRELFLHSYALENIIVGYLDVPASQLEDRSVLVDLFGLCLTGDPDLHARMVDALLDLSAVEAECRGVGTAASLGPEQPVLANVVAETICGIKIQAECEVLDRKMASLQADIGEQAAEVHRNHKFNSGATEPTGGSSPAKLASGLVGTAEVMQLGSRFQQLSVQRAAHIANRPQPQYDKYMGVAHAHAKVLDAAVAELEAQADTMHKQKADGETFRERKLNEMEGAMHVVDKEIGVLEEQQADLLRQLAIVQQQISAAKAERADMEEGRHVFQEGNAFTLEALQHKVDGISLQHQHHLAENAALAECQALIQEAAKGWQTTAKAAEQASQCALQQAGQEYMHAATRHLYYQRALLQLLLRQLTFCVGELKALAEKEGSLERMGMEAIMSDMRAGKERLQAKYLEAHASAQQHFSDVAAVRIAVEAACRPMQGLQPPSLAQADTAHGPLSQQAPDTETAASPPPPLAGPQDPARPEQASPVRDAGLAEKSQPAGSSPTTGLSEELLDLFDSIQHLQQEVAALPQPQHVSPAPGAQSGQNCEQPKDQLQDDQGAEQAAANAQQSGASQDAPPSAKAQVASVSAAVQLDMQMSEVQGAAGEASALASSSANDMLVCTEELSTMYLSQAQAKPKQSDMDVAAAADNQQGISSSDSARDQRL